MPELSVESLPGPWPRRSLAGALVLGVVLAHGVLLSWAVPAWREAADGTPRAAPQTVVHRVALAPVTTPPAPVPPVPVTPSTLAARPPSLPRPADAPLPLPSPAEAATPAAGPPLEVEAVADVAAPVPAMDIPVYAPRLPAAGIWRYRMVRGTVTGQATLTWAPQPEGRYEARLEARAEGLTLLDWVSQGVVDATGAAPDRFSLRRRGRDRQAANFQRDAGKITFSGPTHELPLWPGVQDRLSWLVQLAGVLEAEPPRRLPGARTTLMVVGARGGAERWDFVVLGPEPVAERPALHLRRDTDRRHETRVDLWLDPAQGYRPLRAVMATVDGGPPLMLDADPMDPAAPPRP